MNLLDFGIDFKEKALEKIEKEKSEFNGDKYGKAVFEYVAKTLSDFCSQDERFAEVVYKTRRSLSDCVAATMKGCGNAISDLEVYRRATKFYFPNSEVKFEMLIELGDEPDEKYLNKEPKAQKEEVKAEKPKIEPKKEVKKEESQVIQLSLL